MNRELAAEDMVRVISGIPGDLRTLFKNNSQYCLAGGAIRALVAGETVSDFDIFGPSKDGLINIATKLHASRSPANLITTDNATTVLTLGRIPVQFITRWLFASAADAISSFDFTVAQAAVWHDGAGWKSICADAFYPDLAARRLTYTFPVRDEDACGSLLRARRFIQKGYSIRGRSLAGAIARAVCKIPELGIAVDEQRVTDLLVQRIREVDPLRTVDGVELVPDHLLE